MNWLKEQGIRDSLHLHGCLLLTLHLCQPASLELSVKMVPSAHPPPSAAFNSLFQMILIGPTWVLLNHKVSEKGSFSVEKDIESKHAYENDLTFLELKASYELNREKMDYFPYCLIAVPDFIH